MIPTAAIDFDALLKVVLSSLAAGVGLTVSLCLALYGSIRASEAQRDGRRTSATAFGVIAVLSGLALVGAGILGFLVMTSK